MKKIIIFLVLMSTGIINAQKHIVVAFAVGKTSCQYSTDTDLGYQIYTGNSSSSANKSARDRVKRDYPNLIRVSVEQNGWKAEKGNHLVIIEVKTKYQGCDKYTYGAGFGFNKTEALRNAKKSLGMRNWNWVESKHGYKQVHYRSY
ncbi:hypothetical protein KCTC32516_01198 [Polaribacter huanghezhanensis]|jgi:hypothetical protein|uniref:hypothetical protein n=1 Tax=Polaribacter huanghezhanensis TaxID=1354726 RepID=UPI0026484389|nr:hypothetical protein [Polaribacter huanghezhanensis]WKD85851.1 hypothetical protein KCTC32516_01198 [Polaribacter huanghezhanensis]